MLSYISLFSSAGVGCFGIKEAGYTCVATSELNSNRIQIQKYNKKCLNEKQYIQGDISSKELQNKLFNVVSDFKIQNNIKDITLLLASPPCQGMSVANHKKNNELKRNSLIVESLKFTKEIKPLFFVYENVRSFLKSVCTDIDNIDKSIEEAIKNNLSEDYNYESKVLNFKDYGSNSSRTRTLVIGVRKDLDINPNSLFPSQEKSKTLKEVIGKLESLTKMGQISENDIYHNFRKYKPHMREWIKDLKEGQSAFDNEDIQKKPHQIKDGKIVVNQNKNGDKYKRQFFDKCAPCIHTRNDILASQNTVHPKDDRVFSIRELMLLMTIPKKFKWTNIKSLNSLSFEEKTAYLKKNELMIRKCIGEAIPTNIMYKIAINIKYSLNK